MGNAPSALPAPPSTNPAAPDTPTCPVDPAAREAWLRAAAQQHPDVQPASSALAPPPRPRPRMATHRLSTHREVSSIPRAGLPQDSAVPPPAGTGSKAAETASHGMPYVDGAIHRPSAPSTATPAPPQTHAAAAEPPVPANGETSDAHTSAEGNWIYPSESMFFAAMRRKRYDPREEDMKSIIPIHNAVNERAWREILGWEAGYCDLPGEKVVAFARAGGREGTRDETGSGRCRQPMLLSFAGDSSRLTPRARWNTLLGYERPFDRHDWVVDRCGTRVEYVIDFYQGKALKEGGRPGPSFYLDVRPKLNSWEGVRMRVLRAVGMD